MTSTTFSTGDSTRTAMPGSGKIHYAELANLPSDCRFPEDLAQRVWYEPETHRLAFRGFMSKATFDRLERLAKDPAYQRALEELFRESVFEPPVEAKPHSRKLLVAVAIGIGLLVLGAAALLARLW